MWREARGRRVWREAERKDSVVRGERKEGVERGRKGGEGGCVQGTCNCLGRKKGWGGGIHCMFGKEVLARVQDYCHHYQVILP